MRRRTQSSISRKAVRLTVVSENCKEATLRILKPGDFFGEGALAGQPLRIGSATALTDCEVLRINKKAMMLALHREHVLVGQDGVRGQGAATQQNDEKKRRNACSKQATDLDDGTRRPGRVKHVSNATESQEDDKHQENQSYSSGREITPVFAMRPSG
jgi:CRP-like cAMP-binding protein